MRYSQRVVAHLLQISTHIVDNQIKELYILEAVDDCGSFKMDVAGADQNVKFQTMMTITFEVRYEYQGNYR